MGILDWLFGRRAGAPAPSTKPARGRDAIDAALERLYPDTLELRIAGQAPGQAGPKVVAELAIYPSSSGRAHWHYVTYGLSAIGEKQGDAAGPSGFGLELTFRLLRGDESHAPRWPLQLLGGLAEHVRESGGRFAAGHVQRLPDAALPVPGSALSSALFVRDPELPSIDTLNGRVDFVQVVLIDDSEAAHIAPGAAEQFAAELGRVTPLCISDLGRSPLRVS